MARYRLLDGTVVRGRSYREVVEAMAATKLTEVRSRAGYRRETARRAFEVYGAKISSDSDAEFVRDLLDHQLLERV